MHAFFYGNLFIVCLPYYIDPVTYEYNVWHYWATPYYPQSVYLARDFIRYQTAIPSLWNWPRLQEAGTPDLRMFESSRER